MRNLLVFGALVAASTAPAFAQDVAISGNVALTTDYAFRGITQSDGSPAVQGGFDAAFGTSGVYAGAWASNINFGTGGSNLELDIYGGYKTPLGPVTLDVGALYYMYPGAYYSGFGPAKPKYNNTELYIGATWEWLSAKYSVTTSDFFGVNRTTYGGACGITSTGAAIVCTNPLSNTANSKGSSYLDLTATVPLAEGLNLVGHYGKQTVKNFNQLGYSDYKLGLTYDALGFTFGAAYISTNAKEQFYRVAQNVGNPKDVSDSTVVLSVAKTF
jgi:hypothetical protein